MSGCASSSMQLVKLRDPKHAQLAGSWQPSSPATGWGYVVAVSANCSFHVLAVTAGPPSMSRSVTAVI
jgi:hypothetical protein